MNIPADLTSDVTGIITEHKTLFSTDLTNDQVWLSLPRQNWGQQASHKTWSTGQQWKLGVRTERQRSGARGTCWRSMSRSHLSGPALTTAWGRGHGDTSPIARRQIRGSGSGHPLWSPVPAGQPKSGSPVYRWWSKMTELIKHLTAEFVAIVWLLNISATGKNVTWRHNCIDICTYWHW